MFISFHNTYLATGTLDGAPVCSLVWQLFYFSVAYHNSAIAASHPHPPSHSLPLTGSVAENLFCFFSFGDLLLLIPDAVLCSQAPLFLLYCSLSPTLGDKWHLWRRLTVTCCAFGLCPVSRVLSLPAFYAYLFIFFCLCFGFWLFFSAFYSVSLPFSFFSQCVLSFAFNAIILDKYLLPF